MSRATMSILRRALGSPHVAMQVGIALIRGHWYRLSLPLRGIRFRVGRNFRAYGSLKIRGRGLVVFGNDVTIGMLTTPFTHSVEAEIHIGDRVFLNGPRFGCASRISIGADSIIAECRIMDSNFHSLSKRRRSAEALVKVAEVNIAENVWLAVDAIVLPGTTIEANSVIGAGSVCRGTLSANGIFAGNPAQRVGEVPD